MPKKQTAQSRKCEPDKRVKNQIKEYEKQTQNFSKISESCQKKLETLERVGVDTKNLREDYELLQNVYIQELEEHQYFLGRAKSKKQFGEYLKGFVSRLQWVFSWLSEVLAGLCKTACGVFTKGLSFAL